MKTKTRGKGRPTEAEAMLRDAVVRAFMSVQRRGGVVAVEVKNAKAGARMRYEYALKP